MAQSPLLDMTYGYMPAQIVYTAAELGLADAFGDGAHTSADLAERTGAHEPSLRRLLGALTTLGAAEQRGPGLFALTAEGRRLRADHPRSIRALILLFAGPEMWRTWGELPATLRTGETAWQKVTGTTSFEFFDQNPELGATFHRAMAEHTREVAPEVARAVDFGRFGTVADLGGGEGILLAEILRSAPETRGVLFDLPAGLKTADRVLAEAGVAGRCEIVPGDFFESVPGGADAYVMKSVIHDWDDERAAAILRACRAAMAPDARLLLVETVLPEVVAPADRGHVMSDINMLLATGGRERSEQEFAELLTGAGFALAGMTGPLPPSGYRVIEATPR
ncbi:methyltransferase [Actinomadura macrotermitis]|uniref:Mitomycin biosynthesis 6-O-methyltransferase n=1 Tax=Actinomadura macrotermitis TaxID=2585200 RepID=A0A7K0BLG2_9ACTN|nr:methyltransferase [Actinomadura macrotermitis]MQY01991.1 Mitomycin biosynthesis 6-O-methyltransferase [Actinomadura macrotermitis]